MKRKPNNNRKRDETPRPRVESFVPLVRKIARARRSKYFTPEERESIAWVGALKALHSFDASKGARLSSWICTKAEYELKTAEIKERAARGRCALLPTSRLNAIESRDGIPGKDDERRERDKRAVKIITEEIARQDTQVATILRLALFDGKTQREIGDALGISQSWCGRLYREGLKALQARLKAELQG